MHMKATRKHLKERGYLGGVNNNKVNNTKPCFFILHCVLSLRWGWKSVLQKLVLAVLLYNLAKILSTYLQVSIGVFVENKLQNLHL